MEDVGFGIAADREGSAYVTGYTMSPDFPMASPYQTAKSDLDAFVAKLRQDASGLTYSTHFGGNGRDEGVCIRVDPEGIAHVLGFTESSDLPTVGPFQGDQANWDAFLLKLAYACNCPCNGDPVCDSVTGAADIVQTVDVAFGGVPCVFDPLCPHERTDVNCDGATTIVDIVRMINVAFRGANSTTEFCDPCAP